ncbi:MAG: histidinol phosphatase [Flavobacteriales bacterium]|nr:MAG: histidinol phosphatase [Flavobacteriales bacterium]
MFSFFKSKPALVTDLSWLQVDIHSHLLPGIDDGAPNMETSIHLIEQLHALGLKKFICTPHIFHELYPNTPETILPQLALVKQELARKKVAVQLETAAEYMVDENFKVAEGLMCLPNKYLLIEMSYLNETPNIEKIIFDLQINGYKIILAHPERYNFYHNNHAKYHRFKEMGCLLQLNLLSIVGYYGKAVESQANYMLKNNLYALAGTDLHHEQHLTSLSKAVKSGLLHRRIGQYGFLNVKLFA